jgi:predicted secreted protein
MNAENIKLSLFITLLLAGCTKEDAKADYEVKVNEEFEVIFSSNPSAGNFWIFDNEKETTLIEKVEWIFYPNISPPVLGCSGIGVWSFKGVRRGFETLEFYCTTPTMMIQ